MPGFKKWWLLIFRSKYRRNPSFIKGRDIFQTYKQEELALKLLNPKNANQNYLKHYRNTLKDTVTLEYTEWQPLNEAKEVRGYDSFLDFLIAVLKDFRKNGIIHRDFLPQNILVSDEKVQKYKIFDFGFAIIKGKDPLKGKMLRHFIEKNLGHPYKPYEFTWDDAYSALLVAEKYVPNLYVDYPEKVKEIIKLSNMEQLHEI